MSPRAVSEPVGGFPSVPSSFRFGPVPQGRSFVASLRDRPRRPLTDRPEPESRKTAGKPPKKRHGPEEQGRASQRRDEGPGAGPPGIRAPRVQIRSRCATTRTRRRTDQPGEPTGATDRYALLPAWRPATALG
ncbi:predicted protein [Streptomyces sp. C]|nr:predicted protein [Streptomyces sp. C]